MMFPLPFSRGVFLWGDPIQPADASNAGIAEQKRLELENAITQLTLQADQIMGHSTPIAAAPEPCAKPASDQSK
ncbi:MAG: hypothetical protein JKY20_02045 [Alphaproteobacteria bacterium]|nr:hypothetical protein [Alphaproteobacteria bacterium]